MITSRTCVLFLLSALHEVNAQCPTSSGCTFEPLNPVKCGLNFGCFYDNQCLANLAGFTPEDCCDAPIVAAGVCNTILDEHICGSQACPYDNPCIASQAGYTPAQCIPAPLWSDEFRGSTLNENTWTYDLGGGGWGNMELQIYTQQAVQVTGGNLEITANGNYDMGWTSGRIKTQDNLMFQYGRMEARINVPDVADGLWPAFWTMGENVASVGWPAAGELDIMEIGQGLAITEGVVNNRCIGGAHWEFEGTYATYATWETFPFWLNNTWHNYTLDWTPDFVRTFVDGQQVFEILIQQGPADQGLCQDCEEFHQPHFVLLNLAVGGLFTSVGGSGSSGSSGVGSSSGGGCGSSGASSGSGSSSSGGCFQPRDNATSPMPAVMKVDYVRIFDNGHTMIHYPGSPAPTPDTPDRNTLSPNASPPINVPTPTAPPVVNPPTSPTPPTPPPPTNPPPSPSPPTDPDPSPSPPTNPPTNLTPTNPLPTPPTPPPPTNPPPTNLPPTNPPPTSPPPTPPPPTNPPPTPPAPPTSAPTLRPTPLPTSPPTEETPDRNPPSSSPVMVIPIPTKAPTPEPSPEPTSEPTCGKGKGGSKTKKSGSQKTGCSGSQKDRSSPLEEDEFNRESDALSFREAENGVSGSSSRTSNSGIVITTMLAILTSMTWAWAW